MNNPFLTQDVYDACGQARVYYLDMLVRKQMYGGTPISQLEAGREKHHANIDLYWETAEHSALAGDVRSASTQLCSIVKEWGLYKGNLDLIDAHGRYLDPADPDTVNDFHLAIEHKVVFWATELINTWNEGENKRKADLNNLYMQRNQHLFEVQSQIIQSQGNALDQTHRHTKQYADTALGAVHQVQQAAQSLLTGVQALQHEVQESMRENLKAQQAVTETLEQNRPREREQAQGRTQMRGCLTRGFIIIVLMLACPATFVLAYLILQVVVLRH
jgi:hypothetical protein